MMGAESSTNMSLNNVSNVVKVTVGICFLAIALLAAEAKSQTTDPAQAAQAPAAAAADDLPSNVVIANAIRDLIRNDTTLSPDSRRVTVTTVGESVTLSGQVPTSIELDTLGRIAKENAGSLRVINSVRVR